MRQEIDTQIPATDLLSLAEAKEHLRVTGTDSDTEITTMITAAASILSNHLGFYVQATEYNRFCNDLEFLAQANNIPHLYYHHEAHPGTEYTEITDFNYDVDGYQVKIDYDGTYDIDEYGYKYKITIEAGYTAALFPKDLQVCLKLIVADLYEQRGDQLPVKLHYIPRGVSAIAFNYCLRAFT